MRGATAGPQLVVGIALGAVLALGGPAAPARAEWKSFRSLDPLTSDEITVVLGGGLGRTWVGTTWGLELYDGSRWETVLYRDWVTALHQTPSGEMWVGLSGQGVRCLASCSAAFTTADGLADNTVRAILKDRSGALWCGTARGLSRYDGQQWRTFGAADGLPSDDVQAIAEDAAGALWFGTTGGLARYDGSAWSAYRQADGLTGDYVTSLLVGDDGALWVGCFGGVSRFDGAAWRSFTAADGLPTGYLSVRLEDRDGRLWVGQRDSLACYDGRAWRVFTVADGLPAGYVNGMAQDGAGGIWVGSSLEGLSRFDGAQWWSLTDPDGVLGATVLTMLEDRSGAHWFGGFGGLARWRSGRWDLPAELQTAMATDVLDLFEDAAGALWIGTLDHGAFRYDGVGVRRFTAADGLPSDRVTSICEDDSGRVWCASAADGAARFDGAAWRRFTVTDGLASNLVHDIARDSSGVLWFATPAGVSRNDGSSWVTFDTRDGLPVNLVRDLLVDPQGTLWAATGDGLARYAGGAWVALHYSTSPSGGSELTNSFTSIARDGRGALWLGTRDGLVRFEGSRWGRYGAEEGPGGSVVNAVLADSSGDVWVATDFRVVRHMPERVAPQTAIVKAPFTETADRSQTVVVGAGYAEQEGVYYSFSWDGSPWSYWSGSGLWSENGIPDGRHVLGVRSRDRIGNEDPTPPTVRFEVDATPPIPAIRSPVFGEALQDSVTVLGRASDEKFSMYLLAARSLTDGTWLSLNPDGYVGVPVEDGALGGWDTRDSPDGEYELILTVWDRLGLTGTAVARVIVDNQPPWAAQTSPAKVSAAAGGDVFTTDAEVHVYFPPRFFAEDAMVTIATLGDSALAGPPAPGVRRAGPGYELSWGGAVATPGKAAVLDVALADSLVSRRVALWDSVAGGGWQRLGGTVERERRRISAPVSGAGVYAVFEETGELSEEPGVSSLALVPRVFSPRGSFANSELAIGFRLGMPAAVTVRVYNRAGRLVRELLAGESLAAGANLVRWDGRDAGGEIAEDGLYIVTVEALGETAQQTVSIVR